MTTNKCRKTYFIKTGKVIDTELKKQKLEKHYAEPVHIKIHFALCGFKRVFIMSQLSGAVCHINKTKSNA